MEPSTAEVEEDEYSFDDYTEEHEQLIQSIEASLVQPPPLTPWSVAFFLHPAVILHTDHRILREQGEIQV